MKMKMKIRKMLNGRHAEIENETDGREGGGNIKYTLHLTQIWKKIMSNEIRYEQGQNKKGIEKDERNRDNKKKSLPFLPNYIAKEIKKPTFL